jgi:D-arginine dehydrogenase
MSETSDIIVIGAGIAGASAAAELSGSCKVTVLEMEDRPGYHSTGRSAAMWIPQYGPEQVRALTRASGSFLKNPPPDFSNTPLTGARRTFILGLPGEEVALEEYRQQGMHEISIDDALKAIPLLRPDAISTILLDDTCLDLDVDALHQAFLRRLRHNGGSVHCSAQVQSLARSANTWKVATASGTFEAPIVVNAAGAWADVVAQRAGIASIGLQPKRRSVAIIPPPGGADCSDWPTTITAAETFYFRPQSGMLLVSPADATPVEPHDAWADDLKIAEAIDAMQGVVDIEVTRLEHTWGGLRTFSPDGELVIGFDPADNGFFWLAGQGGYGIQTSPAASRVAAALALGEGVPSDIAAFGVEATALAPHRYSKSS